MRGSRNSGCTCEGQRQPGWRSRRWQGERDGACPALLLLSLLLLYCMRCCLLPHEGLEALVGGQVWQWVGHWASGLSQWSCHS